MDEGRRKTLPLLSPGTFSSFLECVVENEPGSVPLLVLPFLSCLVGRGLSCQGKGKLGELKQVDEEQGATQTHRNHADIALKVKFSKRQIP